MAITNTWDEVIDYNRLILPITDYPMADVYMVG